MKVHLTATGVLAGWPGCVLAARTDRPRPFTPYVHAPEERGAHYAYAPESMVSGEHPEVCQDCVQAFKDAAEVAQ